MFVGSSPTRTTECRLSLRESSASFAERKATNDVVRELVQRRSLNLRDCGFESRLRHLVITWVDWTWESKLSVKQSLSMSNVGSIPSRPTDLNMARSDVGICSQPLKLALAGSIPVRVTT